MERGLLELQLLVRERPAWLSQPNSMVLQKALGTHHFTFQTNLLCFMFGVSGSKERLIQRKQLDIQRALSMALPNLTPNRTGKNKKVIIMRHDDGLLSEYICVLRP
jgi:hypothetical protein